jgi:arylsulfatase A-like enzyme
MVVDELGWDDVSWHNPSIIMPNLGTLARQGVVLEAAYGAPHGSSARAALLTGRYPSRSVLRLRRLTPDPRRTGYQFVGPANMEPVGLPTNLKLLPEYLAELGYTSHALGKWGLGFCHQDYLPTRWPAHPSPSSPGAASPPTMGRGLTAGMSRPTSRRPTCRPATPH